MGSVAEYVPGVCSSLPRPEWRWRAPIAGDGRRAILSSWFQLRVQLKFTTLLATLALSVLSDCNCAAASAITEHISRRVGPVRTSMKGTLLLRENLLRFTGRILYHYQKPFKYLELE
jgi:hypothetical protein